MKDKLNLLTALAKAQRKFSSLEESARNNHQKYSYAKLCDLYNTVKKPLDDAGITLTHHRCIDSELGKIIQVTTITHRESGEYLDDEVIIESERPGPQGFSAACTYAKKMGIKNLCAIDAGEDDNDMVEDHIYIENKKFVIDVIKSAGNKEVQNNLWIKLKDKFRITTLDNVPEDTLNKMVKFLKI